ncbi:helix-turn-helix domain-containing protein [Variovorax ureilyticus]|uniref:Helix-turn-helix domain-containing protein n=1 Tax=Variovorax ureilyticus TaxID=1836198 RepID=A0ABU8VR52_9BURK
MRQIRQVLRLHLEADLSYAQVARAVGIGKGTVGKFMLLARAAGVNWGVAQILSDAEIEARLYAAAPFRREFGASKPFQRVLNRYLYVRMAQLATLAACTRFHSVGPRLARWLLMSEDRAHSESFHLPHESLAYMLGVRRVGIIGASSDLQHRGLIRYHRGEITLLDRPGLEAAACGCYASDRHAYERLG